MGVHALEVATKSRYRLSLPGVVSIVDYARKSPARRKEKEERLAQLCQQRDEEREAEERKKEEEAEQQKLKEEETAAAEFDKWKSAFSIEIEGTQEDVQEGQGPLNNFVEYIKKHECVALEDLAAEFNLRTQDCINRVMGLEQMGVS